MKKEMSYLYLVYIGYLETIICYICTKKKETENEKKKLDLFILVYKNSYWPVTPKTNDFNLWKLYIVNSMYLYKFVNILGRNLGERKYPGKKSCT